MTLHRYPLSALSADYARAAVGLACTGGPLLLASPGSVMIWVLAPLAGLFAAFGFRTALRQATRVEVSEDGIRLDGPFGAVIAWERLSALKLHYFSLKRGSGQRGERDGWLQLTIRGDGRRMKIDSALEGFEAIVKSAALAARARGIALDESTLHNLRVVGALPNEAV